MSKKISPLSKILDVSEEKNPPLKKKLSKISKEKNAILIACIAPYVGKKVSPTRILSAQLGISEEFGVESVINEIRKRTDCPTLYLLLNSPGGFVGSSYKVARALRRSFKKIVVFVPHIAASGGTLVALTGNEIVMGVMSQLTPVDPHSSVGKGGKFAKSIVDGFENVTGYFRKMNVKDAPYTYKVLADKYDAQELDRAISALLLMEDYICEVLHGCGYKKVKVKEIAEALVRGFKNHSEVITLEKAQKIGLKAVGNEKYPEEWDVMREWLEAYLLQSADKHIIRYVVSQDLIKKKSNRKRKGKVQVPGSA